MRSYLFVPGDSARKLEKGLGSGADALIIDLEDSVAPSAKEAARQVTGDFLREAKRTESRPRLFVRVNDLASGHTAADLDAVMEPGPDGIVQPKACGGADVAHLAAMIAVREAEYALEDGRTRIMAIATETARSIFALGSFRGASHRLTGIAWGGEDLSADLGSESNRDPNGHYTDPYRLARSLTLMGAGAAEIDAIDTVYTNFRELDGLAAECRDARRDGFVAKMAIHPAQVPVINETFAPTPEEVARAKAIIAAFEADPNAGVVAIDGEMIDMPHLKRARRLMSRV
ncbi:CoA ester lyase [Saliniramus sp.]|uniref:HpcH/HpaI aldolase/citrate lyase family protein n=1 Tax=Saliniramus sp. TaxID=2986772 RepID=UPI002BE416C0|nr:CoA ester lyase [Saliniramus sp.]HMB10185.1 CoA ester lyase [Saliniramus sp.]